MSKPHTIEFIKSIAEQKGGKCLVDNYKNTKQKLEFICKNGHKFMLNMDKILYQKSWCSQCQAGLNEELCRYIFEQLYNQEFKKTYFDYNGHHLELDGFNSELNIAFEYNGKQHYEITPYYSTKTDLDYRKYLDGLKIEYCKKNDIRVLIIPYTIKTLSLQDFIVEKMSLTNKIIDIDYFINNFDKFKKRREEIEAIINSKDGKLLNMDLDMVTIKCKNSHQWTTSTYTIKQGHWCSQCAGKRKYHEIVNKLKEVGIECLSKESDYKDSNSILKFKCNKDHEFNDTVDRIIGRVDEKKRVNVRKPCQMCLRDSQNSALEKIKNNGLQLLNADEYKNKKESIIWVCKNGAVQNNKLKNLMEKLRRGNQLCKCKKCIDLS